MECSAYLALWDCGGVYLWHLGRVLEQGVGVLFIPASRAVFFITPLTIQGACIVLYHSSTPPPKKNEKGKLAGLNNFFVQTIIFYLFIPSLSLLCTL